MYNLAGSGRSVLEKMYANRICLQNLIVSFAINFCIGTYLVVLQKIKTKNESRRKTAEEKSKISRSSYLFFLLISLKTEQTSLSHTSTNKIKRASYRIKNNN